MSKTVLIVEDDFFIRELYQRALVMYGLTVLTAADGKEALEKFDESHPDLVLLDIMLPQLSGMEVLQYIRQQKEINVPVIMVSNMDTAESIAQAKQLGANDYKVKSEITPLRIAQEVSDILLKSA